MVTYGSARLISFTRGVRETSISASPLLLRRSQEEIVYVMPISGPFFPIQLLGLGEFQRASGGIVPTLVLGTSGGAVTALLGVAGNWNATYIRNVVRHFNSSDLCYTPSKYMPGVINWFLVGSLILPSPSAYTWMKKYLNIDFERQPEIIIGTYSPDTYTPALFSTRTDQTSRFGNGLIEAYCGGDLRLLTRATLASVSIPELLPSVKVVEGSTKKYVDGGLYSPSPWSILWPQIMQTTRALKLVYFISTLTIPNPQFRVMAPLFSLVDSMCIRESMDILDQFRMRIGRDPVRTTYDSADSAYARFRIESQLVMFIRPKDHTHEYHFDMTSFTGHQILTIMNARHFLTYEIWV